MILQFAIYVYSIPRSNIPFTEIPFQFQKRSVYSKETIKLDQTDSSTENQFWLKCVKIMAE